MENKEQSPRKIKFPNVPNDVIFPDELNGFLREQIQFLMHENGMLKKNLLEMESKYEFSKEKIMQLEEKMETSRSTEFLTPNQMTSLKIVELSKKLREKNSEIECLKTKYSKLEKSATEIKRQLDSQSYLNIPEKEIKSTILNDDASVEVKKLSDKVSQLQIKLLESKNSNIALKNNLKNANKLLAQEVGDSIEAINCKTWRGRAQIICDLQQKNFDLREKIKYLEKLKVTASGENNSKLESKIDELCKDNENLKKNLEEMKRKFDALKCKHKILENDFMLGKSKIEMMKEQSQRDQDIINTLNMQLSSYNDLKSDQIKQKETVIKKLRVENENLKNQLEQMKFKIENNKVLKPEPKEKLNINETTIENAVETERKKFLQLLEIERNRVESERNNYTKLLQQFRLEKQKIAKLECNIACMNLNQSIKTSYSNTSLKVVEFNLQDKLELANENIKALQTRLEIEKQERYKDFQEFKKILMSYKDIKKSDNEFSSEYAEKTKMENGDELKNNENK